MLLQRGHQISSRALLKADVCLNHRRKRLRLWNEGGILVNTFIDGERHLIDQYPRIYEFTKRLN